MTAFNRLVASYRKQLASNAKTYQAIFVGSMQPIDMVRKRRSEAIKYYQENKEDAIAKGITDESGNPLHYASDEQIAKMPEWAKKRIGKPLPKEDWQKLVFGLVFQDNGKQLPLIYRMRGENVNVKVPIFTLLKFNGMLLQSSTEELARINDAGRANFNIEKELTDKEVEEMIEAKFKNKIIKVTDFDKYCQEHQEFDRFVFIKSTITQINPQPTDNGTQIVRIEDETMDFLNEDGDVMQPVTCWIPPTMEIKFPEGASDIYMIGQPNVNERGKSLSVYGYHVPSYIKNLIPQKKTLGEPNKSSIPANIEDW